MLDSKMFLHVYYWDKKLGGKSKISFAIEDTEALKDIIKHMRSKRLKILSYSIEHRFETKEKPE